MAEQGTSVELYIYDLTNGLASLLSPSILGRQIEGVWHTGVVAYDREFFFGGGGITSCAPGGTQLGPPHRVEPLGQTFVPFQVFVDYLQGLSSTTYSPSSYNLLEHNCNHFSEEVAQFLCGARIPKHIVAQPEELLAPGARAAVQALLDNLVPHTPQMLYTNGGGARPRQDSPDYVTLNSQIEEASVMTNINHDDHDDECDDDEQSCGESSLLHDNVHLTDEDDLTNEDKGAGVSIPIFNNSLIPENQEKLLSEPLCNPNNESNDCIKMDDIFEDNGVEESVVLQTEPKEMVQYEVQFPMMSKDLDESDILEGLAIESNGCNTIISSNLILFDGDKANTHATYTNMSLNIKIKFSLNARAKINKIRVRRKTRKHSTYIYTNKIKSYSSNHSKYSINDLVKQSLELKCLLWKGFRKKFETILYNYKVRKRNILRIL